MKTSYPIPVKNWILRSYYDLRRRSKSKRSHCNLRQKIELESDEIPSGRPEKRKGKIAKKGKRKLEFATRKRKQIAITSASKPKNNPSLVCEICVEFMRRNQLFTIKGCTHIYCKYCIVKYIASKLQENIIHISCPVSRCKGMSLQPDYCRDILPKDVFHRWNIALCEDAIPMAQKFYCPYKDCSALLIDDGGEVIRGSKCPHCRRWFSVQCKVAWHWGIDCEEFQKLNMDERENEDIMLMNLAKEKSWKRCPNCRYYVERRDGCNRMLCRCGNLFRYKCGIADSISGYRRCAH